MAATALIADDDKRFRGSVRMLIQSVAHVVGEAESDETAITLARALGPDVVLIDHDLPRAGGIETARQIRGVQPQILVVLMTSHGEEAYLEGSGLSGADALLPKRYVRAEARAVLRRLFAGVLRPWEGRRERRCESR